MSQAAALVARLAQEGIDPALLGEVAEALFAGEIGLRAIEERRENDRTRKARSRDVMGQPVTSPDPSPLEVSPHTPLPKPPNQSAPYIPQIQGAWNDMASQHGLPQIESIRGKRLKALNARIAEHSVEAVIAAIGNVPRSPHWLGANDWLGNFDSLLRPDNFQRMKEGAYAAKGSGPAPVADPAQVRANRLKLAELYDRMGRQDEAAELRKAAA